MKLQNHLYWSPKIVFKTEKVSECNSYITCKAFIRLMCALHMLYCQVPKARKIISLSFLSLT